MEFTSVELVGGAELAAPIEKAITGPVEKATADERRDEGGGRRVATLWCSGDAAWWSRDAVESMVANAAWQSAVTVSWRPIAALQ